MLDSAVVSQQFPLCALMHIKTYELILFELINCADSSLCSEEGNGDGLCQRGRLGIYCSFPSGKQQSL